MIFLAMQATASQPAAPDLVLKTDHYLVTIHRGCASARAKCDPPELDVMDVTGIKTARFRGRPVFTQCGKKVCPQDGYEFSTLTTAYFVSVAGRFSITSGTIRIVDEQGKWIEK